ncbi:MAG: hypothetical protein ACHQVS_00370 [Candidatus Babeliales bacterium]
MKKQSSAEITPQFIVDKAGKKTGVILDIATFEQLMEKLEDLYLGTLAKDALKDDKKEFQNFETLKKAWLK